MLPVNVDFIRFCSPRFSQGRRRQQPRGVAVEHAPLDRGRAAAPLQAHHLPPLQPPPAHRYRNHPLPPDGDVNRRIRLFLQDGTPAGPTLLLLDLPLAPCHLASASRITLECESGGAGPLLAEPAWAVSCDGRRAGFGTRRAKATEAEVRALEAMRAVSAGAGRGVGGFTYMRGRFERVVGSVDSESYHLVGPAGFFGAHELSFFFLRVPL
ncbi:protein MIZU-KUSSEI 1-like [Elaeis guineensis]|uniref:protein MIZU-KUSSEI 1-like n=1 Tax=Elaeis guineensis var. tenera TaxID=51953 RepID=UPI003C6D5A23